MSQRRLASVILLILVGLVGAVVWELRPVRGTGAGNPLRSDYTLDNFQLTSLDDAGREAFSVQAPHLERDPSGKSLTLTKPQFSFPDDGGGRWTSTSDRAWVAENGVEVRLLDNVEMIGPPSPLGHRTRFSTARLDVFPEKDLASTASTVTITRADSILRGTGLRADLKAQRIQLLADVKGRYAPAR
jgi:lipopolysaccharide export system protein LptC